MLSQISSRRSIRITTFAVFSLFAACSKESPPARKTTSISGQVFTQSQDGSLIKATGRNVTLSAVDPGSINAGLSACSRAWVKNDQMVAIVAGETKPKPNAVPLADRIAFFESLVSSDILNSVVNSAMTTANTVTDSDGRYMFPDVRAGDYFMTATHESNARSYQWMAIVRVHAGVSNSFTLGSDAANWMKMCEAIRARPKL